MIRIVLSRAIDGHEAHASASHVGREARIIGATLTLDGKRIASKWLAAGSDQWLDVHGGTWTHIDFEVIS
jgi:hypothetical protein